MAKCYNIHLFFTVPSLKKIKLNGLKLLLCRNLPPLDVQVEEDKILTSCIFYIYRMESIVDDVKQESNKPMAVM